jgi:pyruvate formate lyase activating enzyme
LQIKGKEVCIADLMGELRKDNIHYKASGGGVTLTGGEALLQPDFCAALLNACRNENWDTAIETSANVPWRNIETILPHLSRIFIDIKHADSRKHFVFTNAFNDQILDNARHVANCQGINLTLRIPVIPTFNDTTEEILEIVHIVNSFKNVAALQLLPFHHFGEKKYNYLGMRYGMSGHTPLSSERMNELLEVVRANISIPCQIGG